MSRSALKHSGIWRAILLAGDSTAILLAQIVSFWLRFRTLWFPHVEISVRRYQLWGVISLFVALLALAWAGAYRLPRRFTRATVSATVLRTMAGQIAAITLIIFVLRLGTWHSERPFLYSRFVVGIGWALTALLLFISRLGIGRLQMACFSRGWGLWRTVLIGPSPYATRMARALREQWWLGYNVVAMLESHDGQSLSESAFREKADVVWLAWPAEQLSSPEAADPLLKMVLNTEANPAGWAMAHPDFAAFLQAISSGPMSADDVAEQLVRRIEHGSDPLAGPRVTFVGSRGIPATYGGVERYVEELSTHLAARGYRVSVYCRPHYASQRGTYRGVELRHLPCIRTKHLEAISHTFLATLHLLFLKDDIVHTQATGPSLLIWLPRLFGRKTVATVQGLDWQRSKWGLVARAVLRISEWTAGRLPHRTIVVSRALERHYREKHSRTVTYIPNGVTRVARRPAAEIRRLGLEKDSYILTVGRLVPEKAHHTLIRAFKRIETNKQLVIAGGSSYTEDYADSLHSLADGSAVQFTGFVHGDMLSELFSNAYLFVSASELEGLPLALLEAMSYGVCILASDIPPHVEMLAGQGHQFRAGDEDDLVSVLQSLLSQPQNVSACGRKLHQHVAEVYGWGPITDATESVYRKLTSSRLGGA